MPPNPARPNKMASPAMTAAAILSVTALSSHAGVLLDGSEFRVNESTAGRQSNVAAQSVSRDGDVGSVAVWSADQLDGDGQGVFGRRYDPNGVPLAGEFQVNAYTTGDQTEPAVALAPNGSFVVVWSSQGQDGDGGGIFARRYNVASDPVGSDFQVNAYTTGEQASDVDRSWCELLLKELIAR